MATITVNVNDETAELFRTKAFHSFGKKKGALGMAFGEAMQDWAAKKEFLDICLKMLREGRDMGKLLYRKREELHERS